MRYFLLSAVVFCGFGAEAQAQSATTDEVVESVEAAYREVRSVQADFVQTTRSVLLGGAEEQRGRLQMRRSGQMRWEFTHPDTRLFVTDGQVMWVYSPADQQAILYEDMSGQAGGMETLLTEMDQIGEKFNIQMEPATDESIVLGLTPKSEGDQNFKSLRLVFSTDYTLQQVHMVDVFDNILELVFSGITLNASIADSVFQFEPPEGVVVTRAEGL
jgi:outer membrane lipoprotein carrier protein